MFGILQTFVVMFHGRMVNTVVKPLDGQNPEWTVRLPEEELGTRHSKGTGRQEAGKGMRLEAHDD